MFERANIQIIAYATIICLYYIVKVVFLLIRDILKLFQVKRFTIGECGKILLYKVYFSKFSHGLG